MSKDSNTTELSYVSSIRGEISRKDTMTNVSPEKVKEPTTAELDEFVTYTFVSVFALGRTCPRILFVNAT